jgi:HCOMODA/2-hydroxy-3-carboxy-muconic semialdehyde decarboxylase
MTEHSPAVQATIQELVLANRILAHEGILDVFGHVSARHPERPDRYLLSRSLSPELVSAADIMEFDLESNPVDQRGRTMYSERPIHGCIYQTRPDVMAVCHNHAELLLPFAVTDSAIRPVVHFAAAIGSEIPKWEIRDEFGAETNMLVVDNDRGRSLARALGSGRVCLMRGHGSVVCALNVRATVFVSITLMQNARVLRDARVMGEVNYLTPGEVRALDGRVLAPLSLDRAWNYWCKRACSEGDGI